MSTPTIRWAAWFGDRDLPIPFPEGWEVRSYPPRGGADIGDSGIEDAFANPIGTRPIRELARGKRTPCIVVDDLSRPTPADRLIPSILRELEIAGIASEHVTILAGVANHRPMMREDFVKKVGLAAVERCRIRNHFSWANCEYVGTTSHGTPISLNQDFVGADLRILVGSVVPHTVPGFAGGAKLVVPGVASIDTALAFHGPHGPKTGLAQIPSPARVDVEEAARIVGVDCIVNVVPNGDRGIAGLVVGDLVEAHRAAVDIGRRVFRTPTPTGQDVCVLSAYPKDNEFLQHLLAFNVWTSAPEPIVHESGTVVVAAAGSEGAGFHSLAGPGMPLYPGGDLRAPVRPHELVFFSPGVNDADLSERAKQDGVLLFRAWHDTVDWLRRRHGERASAAVFPCAAIQLSEAACDNPPSSGEASTSPDAMD